MAQPELKIIGTIDGVQIGAWSEEKRYACPECKGTGFRYLWNRIRWFGKCKRCEGRSWCQDVTVHVGPVRMGQGG
jgi:hypothetical protein